MRRRDTVQAPVNAHLERQIFETNPQEAVFAIVTVVKSYAKDSF